MTLHYSCLLLCMEMRDIVHRVEYVSSQLCRYTKKSALYFLTKLFVLFCFALTADEPWPCRNACQPSTSARLAVKTMPTWIVTVLAAWAVVVVILGAGLVLAHRFIRSVERPQGIVVDIDELPETRQGPSVIVVSNDVMETRRSPAGTTDVRLASPFTERITLTY